MRVGAFQVNEPLPELKTPQALAKLQPWVDVGSVGTLALCWLEAHCQAKELARLVRPGDFFDFTRYRPTILSREGRRQVSVPNAYITYGQTLPGPDFLFFHLLEPHSHGEVYVDSILRLLSRFAAQRYCLLGSMYDFVPHTRPLLVTGGAVGERAQQELNKLGIQSSGYQGPTSIISLIPQRAAEMGLETLSLIVHLPQYAPLEEDYLGTVRLMQVLSSLYDLPMDESYINKANQQLEHINAALDKDPRLKAIIQHLEAYYDSRTEKRPEEEATPPLSPEIERFLTEMEKRFREAK